MFFLGVDAGGTKTHAVVVDEAGKVIGEGHGGEANFHNVGIDAAATSVFIAIKEALGSASLSGQDVAASCVGMASYDTPRDKLTIDRAFDSQREALFGDNLTIVNDAVVGFYTGSKPPGICLISGTGCNCFGIGKDGKQAFAGNWSYILGDEGGSYKLALRILAAIMQAFDGRGEPTMLRELVLTQLGKTNEMEIVDWIYQENPGPADIAALAVTLDEALKKRDIIAQKLFLEHIGELAKAVEAVVRRTALANETFDIVLIGSFFKTIQAIEALTPKIQVISPKATLVYPKVEASIGATILARRKWKEKFHLPIA